MKKILLIILTVFLTSNAFSEMISKNGFYDKNAKLIKNQNKNNIKNPENKIILIYNSGQEYHDSPKSNLKQCAHTADINGFASLVGSKIKDKEIMLYICLLYTSPSPRDRNVSRMPSSA